MGSGKCDTLLALLSFFVLTLNVVNSEPARPTSQSEDAKQARSRVLLLVALPFFIYLVTIQTATPANRSVKRVASSQRKGAGLPPNILSGQLPRPYWQPSPVLCKEENARPRCSLQLDIHPRLRAHFSCRRSSKVTPSIGVLRSELVLFYVEEKSDRFS